MFDYYVALGNQVKVATFRQLETYQHDGVRYELQYNNQDGWSLFVYPESQWLKDFHGESIASCFEQAIEAGYAINRLGLADWHE